MIYQLPLESLFPCGAVCVTPEGTAHPYEPLESTFDGADCFVLFSLGLLKGRQCEITAWYWQVHGEGLERVQPVFDGETWRAEMRS